MESHDETGCQAREGPILCINNCGFFGSAATMNMCSKCHKAMILKQQEAQLAASSIESIMNGSKGGENGNGKDPMIAEDIEVKPALVVLSKMVSIEPPHTDSFDMLPNQSCEVMEKKGPRRCSACKKRVGLTGFSCRCGKLFCAVHRYSDKHECAFDYRAAAQNAIAKANPVVRAEKLDKI